MDGADVTWRGSSFQTGCGDWNLYFCSYNCCTSARIWTQLSSCTMNMNLWISQTDISMRMRRCTWYDSFRFQANICMQCPWGVVLCCEIWYKWLIWDNGHWHTQRGGVLRAFKPLYQLQIYKLCACTVHQDVKLANHISDHSCHVVRINSCELHALADFNAFFCWFLHCTLYFSW